MAGLKYVCVEHELFISGCNCHGALIKKVPCSKFTEHEKSLLTNEHK